MFQNPVFPNFYFNEISSLFFNFRFIYKKKLTHKITWHTVDAGVASPMWNKVVFSNPLIKNTSGTLTQNAPTIPCNITKKVLPHPLKYPI